MSRPPHNLGKKIKKRPHDEENSIIAKISHLTANYYHWSRIGSEPDNYKAAQLNEAKFRETLAGIWPKRKIRLEGIVRGHYLLVRRLAVLQKKQARKPATYILLIL